MVGMKLGDWKCRCAEARLLVPGELGHSLRLAADDRLTVGIEECDLTGPVMEHGR
jgi:hypothetical protein